MASDPWTWTAAQVADFFRNNSESYICDVPNGRLPSLDAFARKLEENDVCGAVLFDAVDTAFLRDDCGITSLGQRSAVIRCIRKLKAQSAVYSRDGEAAPPQTPVSVAATPAAPPSPIQEPQSGVPVFDNSNAKRSGNTQAGDSAVRKRRKLDLSAMSSIKHVLQHQLSDRPAGFFRDQKLPVDKIFFGNTRIGQELVDAEASHAMTGNPSSRLNTLERNASSTSDDDPFELRPADTNFQFQALDTLAGEASYVYKRIHHFLHMDVAESQSESVEEISRHGRAAIAVLPYDAKLLPGTQARSALVFQMQGGHCIAKRENAAFIDSGVDYDGVTVDGLPEGSNTGEWDFLAAKHKSTASDEVLPAYFDSNSEGSLASLEAEMQEDDEDEKETDDGKPAGHRLDAIMDDALNDIANEWRDRVLPKKEEKRAWTVWKQTRQSRTIRDSLIGGAHDLISRLEQRVMSFRKEMHSQEWQTEKQVIDQCRTMEATVEDIEEQRWHIDVWQRKKKPRHVVQHGNGASFGHKSAQAGTQLPRVHPNDRFSVERDAVVKETEDEDEDEHEDFQSAQGDASPAQPEDPDLGQDEDEDACDEMSEQNDGDFLDDSTSPLPELLHGPSEHSDYEQDNSPPPMDSEHSDLGRDISSPSTQAQQSKARRNDQHTDTEDGTEWETLASSSAFFNRGLKEEGSTPTKSRGAAKACDPIEISSDSTPAKAKSSLKTRKAAPRKNTEYSSTPENDSALDVASWDFAHLEAKADRRRVLIKLLAEAGPEMRAAIQRKFRAVRKMKFTTEVLRILGALQRDFSGDGEEECMIHATKLFVAYQFCRADVYLEDSCALISWDSIILDKLSVETFSSMLEQVLSRPNLWRMPKAMLDSSPQKANLSNSLVIDLVDSSEEEHVAGTPRKKRTKKVRLNATAEQSQAAAYHRQQRFNEMQKSGSSSQELQAMIQSDPSRSTIVINPLASKEDGEDFIFIDKNIARALKEHQITGIRFMWRELTANGDEGGQGCILAHTMGLGKTLQTIATLIAINEAAQSRNPRVYKQIPDHLRPPDIQERQLRMLIMLPAALVQNWRYELKKWASHVLSNIFLIESGLKAYQVVDVLRDWYRLGGVLIITYSLFQRYVHWRDPDSKAYSKLNEYGPQLDKFLTAAPEIVVADEAHALKNPGAKITQAANCISTQSRIGLTGTPMSNDVDEIYSLVSFAAPNYLGEKRWFNQQYSNPISQGNRSDSTQYQVRKMLKKLAVLRNQIEPKVNRADIYVLRGELKPKLEFVITLPLSNIQRTVYKKYLEALGKDESNQGTVSQTRIFAWLAALTLLMNHPLAFKRKLMDLKPASKSKKARREPTPPVDNGATVTSPAENDIDPDDLPDMDEAIQSLAFSDEVKQDMIAGISDELRPECSKKMSLLLVLLRLAEACNDKVMVFSGSIPTLNYVQELLKSNGMRCERIDGGVPIHKRQAAIDNFSARKTGILLMSTKAGYGLNVQAANRVVILDFGFNPSHEEQAVGRAYRIGQPKPVYVYRLVIGGTFEDNIYDKQMFKTSLTSRVVDKKNPRRIALGNAGDWLYEPREIPQEDLSQWLGKDEHVLHKVLKKQIQAGDSYAGPHIRKLTTIETLHADAADPPLDELEQREVEEELAITRNQRIRERQTAAMPPPAFTPTATPLSTKSVSAKSLIARFPTPHGLPTTAGNSYHPSSTMPTLPGPVAPHYPRGVRGAPPSTNPHGHPHGLP